MNLLSFNNCVFKPEKRIVTFIMVMVSLSAFAQIELCPDTLYLSGQITSDVYNGDETIICEGLINTASGGSVELYAGAIEGEYIELAPGFEADGSVNFEAGNIGCDPSDDCPLAASAVADVMSPQLINQVQNSPLTNQFAQTFIANNWLLDFNMGIEIFPDFSGLPVNPPADAQFVWIPVFDSSNSNMLGIYGYTFSPSSGIEGADFIEFPNDNQMVIFASPFLDEGVVINNPYTCDDNYSVDFICPVALTSQNDSACSPYLNCFGAGLLTLINSATRLGLTQQCLTYCSAQLWPACAACAIGAGAVTFGIWWNC